MTVHKFYAYNTKLKKAWSFSASDRWFREHNNGCAISVGFEVPDDLSIQQLAALKAQEVPYDEWNHSGCQSSCVKRGDANCRW